MKLLFIVLTVLANFAWAQIIPDYAKESRWASHVEDGLMDGDIVWLSNNDHEFIAIYTPSETDTKQTAIVVHGLGVHPDWPQVIQPLRVALTEKGFNTLSIQMPVLANGIGGDSYTPLLQNADRRIKAAIDYVQRQDLSVNTLIAHSLGSKMSAYYLANNKHPFKRFVGIGMGKGVPKYLAMINIPILDLYGDDDIPTVLSAVTQKQQALKYNSNYTQKMVGADHFFNDKEELLIDTVSAWLN
jgi:alpha/beta superfamily hydrolase